MFSPTSLWAMFGRKRRTAEEESEETSFVLTAEDSMRKICDRVTHTSSINSEETKLKEPTPQFLLELGTSNYGFWYIPSTYLI